MDQVRINKQQLIDKIKENKAKHDAFLREAMDGYWDRCECAVGQAVVDVTRKVDWLAPLLALKRPEEHSEDYTRVLAMLEMSVEETIMLDAEQFSWYVLNRWQWRERFLHLAVSYGATGATGPCGALGATGPEGF